MPIVEGRGAPGSAADTPAVGPAVAPESVRASFPDTFESAKEFRDVVDALAIEQNKEMSQWQEQCGGKSKVYVCKDFIKRKKAYEMKVRLEKQDPEAFLKKHPYKGEGACPFRASAYKSRTQAKGAWIFARKTSVLDHAASCTARGKIKARQLLNHPSFCQSVTDAKASVAGAGKVTMKALVNTSQQMGFGEARLSQNTIYYMARRLSETADPNLKTTPKTKPSPNPAGKTPRSAPNRGGGASVVEAAAAAVGVGKRNRSCARCQVAGRTGEEVYRHKGSNCPFEVDLDSIRIPADPEMTARGTPPTPATAAIPLAPTVVGTTAPAPAPAPAPPPTVSIAPAPAPTPMAE